MVERTWTVVSANVSSKEKQRLMGYCRQSDVTASTVLREALTFYLNAKESEQGMPLERELDEKMRAMRAMENRMATLLAKMGRAVAQNMYFTMSPFIFGGWPREAVSQETMDDMWHRASQFAGMWMKQARTEDEGALIKAQLRDGSSAEDDEVQIEP